MRRHPKIALAMGLALVVAAAATAYTKPELLGTAGGGPEAVSVRRGLSRLTQLEVQSMDGTGNNRRHQAWGQAGTPYSRVARARYADGQSQPVSGPDPRYVSNRVFNDTNQNLFSERGVSQWVFTWGQFLDHTFGLRDGEGEAQDLAFDPNDPLEAFTNTLGYMPFTRSAAAPGTGVRRPREQINTVSSYIDAWAVYGGTEERLEWLREGPVDGDMSNNEATLLMPGDLLPRRTDRGDAATAPTMDLNGQLIGQPDRAMVAGDVRANENTALLATHTLFAREHNRIVSLLPDRLTEEQKFQIARRVVIAEQQYITYSEFLPSLGIRLPRYRGYNPRVNPNLSNEFATVGYRAHSMIHGELELETEAARYTAEQLEAFEAMGLEVELSDDGAEVGIAVPLNLAFFNPDLVPSLGLGPVLQGIGLEAEYNNDEQIDNQLRSVLFQVPSSPANPGCLDGPELPACYDGVLDLGAIDIERGRDHGMPSYNQLRRAYGLAPKTSFEAITGEPSAAFPADPELTPGAEVDDPDSLDFVRLLDVDGNEIPPDSEEAEGAATGGIRRTPLAARLRAIYGTVDSLDAFTGMVAEAHVPGTEFGELQQAIWARQFRALRDGDRFFYLNDPGLTLIRQTLDIDYRHTLAEVIALNSDIPEEDLAPNVFVAPTE
jgi:hypothetical protein